MAVQIPDPGTGNGQTGDNEYVFRKKVKDNFSDKTNAASRLVGTELGNLAPVGAYQIYTNSETPAYEDIVNTPKSPLSWNDKSVFKQAFNSSNNMLAILLGGTFNNRIAGLQVGHYGADFPNITGALELNPFGGNVTINRKGIWHQGNATKDSNGFLKAASPIVKVFADKVELNDDAVNQNVTYKKNGIGDYTITTQSGLSTDGWYIELPKDMNGNPKVAVTLSEVDGVISLKTYKRIFSMETFTFEPDLDNPLDIPDTRWIDLRLNEIPFEMPDDIQTEV